MKNIVQKQHNDLLSWLSAKTRSNLDYVIFYVGGKGLAILF